MTTSGGCSIIKQSTYSGIDNGLFDGMRISVGVPKMGDVKIEPMGGAEMDERREMDAMDEAFEGMDNMFGAGMLYTLEDEDGNEQEFELLGELEYEGASYCALIPFHENEEELLEESGEFIVLKKEMVGGEEMLCTIEDDAEYETVGGIFLKQFEEWFDEDNEE